MPQTGFEMVGFPAFWNQVHDKYPLAFAAIHRLHSTQAHIFVKPLDEPLHYVIRHISKVAVNSLGALTIVVLNGYGHDGIKIARSMFEADVTVQYLAKHPDKLDDYLDFHHITTKKTFDYLDKNTPEIVKALPASRRTEIEQEFARVVARFTTKRGVRSSWSDKSVAQMAAEVGLAEQYETFYSWACAIHHANVSGLSTQTDDSGDVEVAPSLGWVDLALISGHRAALSLLTTFNSVAALGMDKQLEDAHQDFEKAWTGTSSGVETRDPRP
jgi:hypothetical protein